MDMAQVGSYEAKTHLPKLLERVQQGERIVITKHGHPVAELVPYRGNSPESVRKAVDRLKANRNGRVLGGLKIKELITQGRKR